MSSTGSISNFRPTDRAKCLSSSGRTSCEFIKMLSLVEMPELFAFLLPMISHDFVLLHLCLMLKLLLHPSVWAFSYSLVCLQMPLQGLWFPLA
jgi:hypothetical protein